MAIPKFFYTVHGGFHGLPEKMKKSLVMDLKKAQPTEDADGVLTKRGMAVAHKYAKGWVENTRDLELERKHPELAGLFYDIRADSELAREHAIEE